MCSTSLQTDTSRTISKLFFILLLSEKQIRPPSSRKSLFAIVQNQQVPHKSSFNKDMADVSHPETPITSPKVGARTLNKDRAKNTMQKIEEFKKDNKDRPSGNLFLVIAIVDHGTIDNIRHEMRQSRREKMFENIPHEKRKSIQYLYKENIP